MLLILERCSAPDGAFLLFADALAGNALLESLSPASIQT